MARERDGIDGDAMSLVSAIDRLKQRQKGTSARFGIGRVEDALDGVPLKSATWRTSPIIQRGVSEDDAYFCVNPRSPNAPHQVVKVTDLDSCPSLAQSADKQVSN